MELRKEVSWKGQVPKGGGERGVREKEKKKTCAPCAICRSFIMRKISQRLY